MNRVAIENFANEQLFINRIYNVLPPSEKLEMGVFVLLFTLVSYMDRHKTGFASKEWNQNGYLGNFQ